MKLRVKDDIKIAIYFDKEHTMGLFGNESTENENNNKSVLVVGVIAIMAIILGLITYVFYYNQGEVAYENEVPTELAQMPTPTPAVDSSADSADSSVADSTPPIAEGAPKVAPNTDTTPSPAVDSTPAPVATPTPTKTPEPTPKQEPTPETKPQPTPTPATTTAPKAKSTIASLKYAIKPNNADVYRCLGMRNGSWIMPKKCENDILEAVQRLIDANNELIAIEVSGIVDGNPYSGPSAELKQEGLASFRAREGIIAIIREYSNIAAFEGPSLQEQGKRGFQVKAYYLQR